MAACKEEKLQKKYGKAQLLKQDVVDAIIHNTATSARGEDAITLNAKISAYEEEDQRQQLGSFLQQSTTACISVLGFLREPHSSKFEESGRPANLALAHIAATGAESVLVRLRKIVGEDTTTEQVRQKEMLMALHVSCVVLMTL